VVVNLVPWTFARSGDDPSGPSRSRTTQSDDDGRFDFDGMPPDTYLLSTMKGGFTQADPFRLIKVADGEKLRSADITMTRALAIAGCVLDDHGDPVEGARVTALRSRLVAGRRRLDPMGSASSTNDLGQYRIYNLLPGTYYVSAVQSPVRPADRSPVTAFAATYYPGSVTLADAQALTVRAGADATGVDITLVTARTVTVAGNVIDSQGRPAAGGSLSISERFPAGARPTHQSGEPIRPDGAFSMVSAPVRPGRRSVGATAEVGNTVFASRRRNQGPAAQAVPIAGAIAPSGTSRGTTYP
jgi:protocatechuate 3,4-dioxygenase beta subunit